MRDSINPTDGILFLTNNCNTEQLYKWLKKKHTVIRYSEPINIDFLNSIDPRIIISYNYKHIIKKEVINHMEGRVINLHTSLLPWNRGANPNFWSFIDHTPSGVSIHMIDEFLDTGDIICQKEVEFDITKETFKSTYEKLQIAIEELFISEWDNIWNGRISPIMQKGIGTYHTSKDFRELNSKIEINWDDNIAEFLEKMNNVR